MVYLFQPVSTVGIQTAYFVMDRVPCFICWSWRAASFLQRGLSKTHSKSEMKVSECRLVKEMEVR